MAAGCSFPPSSMANEDICRFHALNLGAWIKERLIDELSPGPSA